MNLLFDFGGTWSRFALSDGKNISNIRKYPTVQNYNEFLVFLENKKEEITGGENIDIISGGIAGTVNDNKLINAPNILNWSSKPIADDFITIFNAESISLENDAALGALAEANLGAGKDFKIVAFVTIGTGVGGARVVDKTLDESSSGFEPGHQILDIDGNKNYTFEDLVSGSGITKRTGKHVRDIPDPEFWREIEKFIAYGLNDIVLLWSPDVVILGGGIVNRELVDIGRIQNNLEKVIKFHTTIPPILKTSLGEDVTLHGAMLNLKRVKN